jgi:hypothetical protein
VEDAGAAGCGWGTDCGAWPGACRPSAAGLASGGICGDAVDEALRGGAVGVAPVRADEVFAASVRPGAIADTSAANPAVRPAAPAITHRRVRTTRTSAASRWSWTTDGSLRMVTVFVKSITLQ